MGLLLYFRGTKELDRSITQHSPWYDLRDAAADGC